jgi:protein-disulfide isomerase
MSRWVLQSSAALPQWQVPVSEAISLGTLPSHRFRSTPVKQICTALVAVFALAGFATSSVIPALAQSAVVAQLAKPMSLPDMSLGDAKAPVTIYEFASMSCPHCAAFEQNVFPMIRSKYIDTGKVRYVFREFPLDIKAAAASMLARCIADGNAEKFFAIIDTMFKQQGPLMTQTQDTLQAIGREAGMDDKGAETCTKDQALLDKLSADEKYANEELKVDATPTFFINGSMTKGAISFEEFEAKLKPLLKK